MSVTQHAQLPSLANALASLLQFTLPPHYDPFDPHAALTALEVLFPEAEAQLRAVRQAEVEEQWSEVLGFIEDNMLEGQRMDIEQLGEEEIAEIYMLLIDFTEQALQEDAEFEEQQVKREEKKQEKGKQEQVKQSRPEKEVKQKKVGKASKDKQKPKEKSKPKSSQKQVAKSKPQIKPAPRKSPPSSKPKPKKEVLPDQPMQNEAIREITTAMQGRKKQGNKLLFKDPKSTEQVAKARRQFDYYLSEFKRQGKEKGKKGAGNKGILDQYFLKALEKRQKGIQQTVINEQLRYFLALRDKKVAFINKIHKLTESLQRQRMVEREREQRRVREEERARTQARLEQGNALFEKNMQLLRENSRAMRRKNELQEYDERAVCREMEECMRRKKLGELSQLRALWEQQNLRLSNITGDEERVQRRLIELYRKHRP